MGSAWWGGSWGQIAGYYGLFLVYAFVVLGGGYYSYSNGCCGLMKVEEAQPEPQPQPTIQQQKPKPRPRPKPVQKEGDPKPSEVVEIYDAEGKATGKKKAWAKFNDKERELYRQNSGSSYWWIIILLVVVAAAVGVFLMMSGGSDDEELLEDDVAEDV